MVDNLLAFLADYYLWFLIAAGVFLFALIGLIIGTRKNRRKEGGDMLETSSAAPTVDNNFRTEAAPAAMPDVNNTVNVVNTPVAPVTEPVVQATVPTEMAMPQAPVQNVAPVSQVSYPETPVAPVQAAPIAPAAPVMETPSVMPVVEPTPVVQEPVITPTVSEPIVNMTMPSEPVINLDNSQNQQM